MLFRLGINPQSAPDGQQSSWFNARSRPHVLLRKTSPPLQQRQQDRAAMPFPKKSASLVYIGYVNANAVVSTCQRRCSSAYKPAYRTLPGSRHAGDANPWKRPRTGEARQGIRADPPQVSPSPLDWIFGSKLVAFSAHWAGLADSAGS